MTLPEITTDVNFLEPQEGEEALGRFDIAHDDGDVIEFSDHVCLLWHQWISRRFFLCARVDGTASNSRFR